MWCRNITEVTRKDFFILFSEGYYDTSMSIFSNDCGEKIIYPYYGVLSEIEFLSNLYDLEQLPSTDNRFRNAKDDIRQHTVNNDDWNFGWVFYDSRFNMKECDDVILLDFLCMVFHPAIRNENGYWKCFLDRIQALLRPNGYELYAAEYISGRALYKWRELTECEIANYYCFVNFLLLK